MNKELFDLQSEIISKLTNAKKNNRLSHAYIFSGPMGVGKNLLAHYFALLLYSDDKVDLESNIANQIFKDEFLNLFTIYSDSKTIKKNQITDLQEEFSKTSQLDGPRIYIINDAEKMNLSSQNSLLKFIEEPANNTYGILLTTNKDLILPTIKSRCQILDFKPMDYNLLKNQMIKSGINKKYATFLAYLTNDLKNALDYASNEDMIKFLDTFISFMSLKSNKDLVLYLENNKVILQNDLMLKYFINLVILFYEDILNLYNQNLDLNFKEYAEKASAFKNRYSKEDIENKIRYLYDLEKKLVSSNVLIKNLYLSLMANLM